jgi:hypothetical protein
MKLKQTKERILIEEIAYLFKEAGFHWQNNPDHEDNIIKLERVKENLIRSCVVQAYVLVDETLGYVIENYFLSAPKKGMPQEAKDKSLLFHHFLTQDVFYTKKLDIVGELYDVPDKGLSSLRALNNIRNAMAHSYSPKERREYKKDNKMIKYKNKDIYTMDGFKLLNQDIDLSLDLLGPLAFPDNYEHRHTHKRLIGPKPKTSPERGNQ